MRVYHVRFRTLGGRMDCLTFSNPVIRDKIADRVRASGATEVQTWDSLDGEGRR